MDPLYPRAEALAKRMIGAKGKPGIIRRPGGTSGPVYAPVIDPPTDYPCVFVETRDFVRARDATLIQSGDRMGIISPAVAVEPDLTDRIVIDGSEYSFVEIRPLNPGGLNLLYRFLARA